MTATAQLAGETASQYVARLESELDRANARLERYERNAETESDRLKRMRKDDAADLRDRDFLRSEIADLALWCTSPSAPRTKQQMARLLDGLLHGESWRNGGWRR